MRYARDDDSEGRSRHAVKVSPNVRHLTRPLNNTADMRHEMPKHRLLQCHADRARISPVTGQCHRRFMPDLWPKVKQ